MRLTNILIIVNLAIFFLTVAYSISSPKSGDFIAQEYGFSPRSFLSGNYYVVLTSIFLHADILHVGFNMIALFLLGNPLESEIGQKRFLISYFVGGMIANLAMLIPIFRYSSDTVGVGASGAISALIGVGTFLIPKKLVLFPSIIPVPYVVAGVLYFLSTFSNLFVPSQIGYPVHMLGLISGAAFGLSWSTNRKQAILIFVLTLILILVLPVIIVYLLV